MKVTQRSLASYRKEVDAQAELARELVRRSLDAYFADHPRVSTADGREFAIDLLKAVLPNFTDAAGTLAADFFDEMMEAQDIDARARLYDPVDYGTVEEKVRYFAGELNGGDERAFREQVADATRYFVKRSAYDNMVMNCEGNNVRYARVPSGLETCPFCFMLASRGFVYHSEAKALGEHGYHDSCSCTVVPGAQVDGESRVRIEGYDPVAMHRNWLACEKTIGGREQARVEWLALDEAARNGYIERHGSEAKAFARFEQNRIQHEVETRDWHWLYTGKAPITRFEADADPDGKERALASILSRCGFAVWFRKPVDINRVRTADSTLNGVAWEMKNPDGTSDKAIKNQLKKAVGVGGKAQQGDRVVISNVSEETALSFEEMCRQAEELWGADRFVEVKELLIVDKDGRMRRFKER